MSTYSYCSPCFVSLDQHGSSRAQLGALARSSCSCRALARTAVCHLVLSALLMQCNRDGLRRRRLFGAAGSSSCTPDAAATGMAAVATGYAHAGPRARAAAVLFTAS